MSITVRCHSCDNRVLCPDKAAGRKVRCPRCQTELEVPPQPTPGVPDWLSAPPPVRRSAPTLAPAPDPSPDSHAPAPQELDSEPPSSSVDDADYEPEPWYYHFIERYVTVAMWGGIIVCALSFVGLTVFLAFLGAGLSALSTSAAGTAGGGCILFLYWVYAAVIHCLMAFAIIYGCSWLLLALDAARNLRGIRLRLRG